MAAGRDGGGALRAGPGRAGGGERGWREAAVGLRPGAGGPAAACPEGRPGRAAGAEPGGGRVTEQQARTERQPYAGPSQPTLLQGSSFAFPFRPLPFLSEPLRNKACYPPLGEFFGTRAALHIFQSSMLFNIPPPPPPQVRQGLLHSFYGKKQICGV